MRRRRLLVALDPFPCCQRLSVREATGPLDRCVPVAGVDRLFSCRTWKRREDRMSPLVGELDDALPLRELCVEVLVLSGCQAEGSCDLAALGGAGEVHHDLRAEVRLQKGIEKLNACARDDHADAVLAHE